MKLSRTCSDNNNNNTRWVEFDSIKTLQCIVSNVYCEITKRSLPFTFALNLPLRVWSCITGIRDRKYAKVFHDVLALSFLFLPHGRYMAISVDITSKLMDLYPEKFNSFPYRNEGKDYSIYENAIRCLGLSKEDAQNQEILETRYDRLSEEHRKRIKQLKDSGLHNLAKIVEGFLKDLNTAYRTAQVVLEENKEEKE